MKFGIIGFGIFAEKRLVPGFNGSKASIHAITKQRLDEARQKAEEYGIPRYFDDPAALLRDGDVDAVYIASPNNLHVEHVALAARNGKDVICEKPMATTIEDAISMARTCKQHGVHFMIAHCYRFAGSCIKIKELIDSGHLGEIEFIQTHFSFPAETSPRAWVFNKQIAGGGPIFDIGVHMVDLIRFLLSGKDLLAFKGFTRGFHQVNHPKWDVEKSGSILMEFDGGTQASVSCSFDMPYLTSIEVHGTKRSLNARYFTIVERDAELQLFTDKDFKGPEQTIVVNNGNFYNRMINHFVENIENHSPNRLVPGVEDGLLNQIVLNQWTEGMTRNKIDSILHRVRD
jgi:xylose dehydrogenase (NAD/NADP)